FDAFVLKLDPTGTSVQYLTYLGGPGFDNAFGIALDAAGKAHVTRLTPGGLPAALETPPQPGLGSGGGPGLYAAKLNSAGTLLLFRTYLGAATNEDEGQIAVDAAGSAYVTLGTFASTLPSTFLAFSGGEDAYLVKLGTQQADVSVTNFGNPNPVPSGNFLTFTLTIRNAGPDPAINVKLLSAVPAGTIFQSLTPGTGCVVPAFNGVGPIQCAVGTLANGATATLTLVVLVTAVSAGNFSVNNSATVTTLTPDPNSANDTAVSNVTITPAGDITGTVTQGATGPSPGTAISGATIRVYNSDTATVVGGGFTSAVGTYAIGALPPRNYKVSAEMPGFAIQFFNNQANFPAGNLVAVNGGATTGPVNFALAGNAGGIIGKVTLLDGVTPVVGASVSIKGLGGDNFVGATTDSNGNYNTLRRLAAGAYI